MRRPIEGDTAITIINKIVDDPTCIREDEYYNRAMGVIVTALLDGSPSIVINRLVPAACKEDGPVRRLLVALAEQDLYELPQDLRPHINQSASQVAVSVPDAAVDDPDPDLTRAIKLSMAGGPDSPAVGKEPNQFFNRQPVLAGAGNALTPWQQELSDKLYRGYYTNCDVVDMIVRLQQDLPLFESISPFKEDSIFINAIKSMISDAGNNLQQLPSEREKYHQLNALYDSTLYMKEVDLTAQLERAQANRQRNPENNEYEIHIVLAQTALDAIKVEIEENRQLLLTGYNELYPYSDQGQIIARARNLSDVQFTREDLLYDTPHQEFLRKVTSKPREMKNFLVMLQAKGCYMPMSSGFPDGHQLNVQSRERLDDAGTIDAFNKTKQVKYREMRAHYNFAEIQYIRGGGNCYYLAIMQGHIQNAILAEPAQRNRLFQHLANLIEGEIISSQGVPYAKNGGSVQEMQALVEKFRAAANGEAWPHLQDFLRDMETAEFPLALIRAAKYMLFSYVQQNKTTMMNGILLQDSITVTFGTVDNYLDDVILPMDSLAEGVCPQLAILPLMLGSKTNTFVNPYGRMDINNRVFSAEPEILGQGFNAKYGLGSRSGFPYQASEILHRGVHYDLLITPEQQAKIDKDQVAPTNVSQPFSFNVDPEIIPYIHGHPVLSAPVQLASVAGLKAAPAPKVVAESAFVPGPNQSVAGGGKAPKAPSVGKAAPKAAASNISASVNHSAEEARKIQEEKVRLEQLERQERLRQAYEDDNNRTASSSPAKETPAAVSASVRGPNQSVAGGGKVAKAAVSVSKVGVFGKSSAAVPGPNLAPVGEGKAAADAPYSLGDLLGKRTNGDVDQWLDAILAAAVAAQFFNDTLLARAHQPVIEKLFELMFSNDQQVKRQINTFIQDNLENNDLPALKDFTKELSESFVLVGLTAHRLPDASVSPAGAGSGAAAVRAGVSRGASASPTLDTMTVEADVALEQWLNAILVSATEEGAPKLQAHERKIIEKLTACIMDHPSSKTQIRDFFMNNIPQCFSLKALFIHLNQHLKKIDPSFGIKIHKKILNAESVDQGRAAALKKDVSAMRSNSVIDTKPKPPRPEGGPRV